MRQGFLKPPKSLYNFSNQKNDAPNPKKQTLFTGVLELLCSFLPKTSTGNQPSLDDAVRNILRRTGSKEKKQKHRNSVPHGVLVFPEHPPTVGVV